MMRVLAAVAVFSLLAVQSVSAGTITADFSGGDDGYTVQSTTRADNGQPYDSPWTRDGSGSFITDGSQGVAHSRLTSPTYTASGGAVELSFDHRYSIEGGLWDGGAAFVSVNGAAFTQVPGSDFSANGYTAIGLIGNHDLRESNGGSGEGFGGDSAGYGAGTFITSVASLGSLSAGDTVAVQFLMANDEGAIGTFSPNWQMDSVSLSGVVAVPEPSTLVLSALGCFAIIGMMIRRNR